MRHHRLLIVILVVALLLFWPGGTRSASAGPFINCASQTQIPTTECTALVTLYNSTNGANWYHNDNWLVTDTPGDWWGVNVSNGHVISISLAMNSLNGNLPAELADLPNLQLLDLSVNQLSGSIPPQLGNLTNLLSLIVYYNQLSGSIPPQLGNLANLQTLDLQINQLSGSLPTQLGSLASLQSINLFSNQQLNGHIPLSFTALTHLVNFNALGTWLCEPQDASFQNWRTTVTSWSSPGLCYVISGQIIRWGNPLAGVTLSDGNGHSTASGADGAYTLADLPPHSYTITPTLTGFFFFPASLDVSLTNANVTGQDFHAYKPFTSCAVQHEIPTAECSALVALYNRAGGASWRDHTNWLVTDTPSIWHGVTLSGGHVTGIDLGSNLLSGSLPPELGNLANLQSLILGFNHLNGSIPSQLGNLANLQTLDLDENQIGGSIPPQLGNLANLQYLDLHDNQLSGSLPSQLSGLTNLQRLYLRWNNLSGQIPLSLTALTHLVAFDDQDTWLCEPQDAGFQAWKATVTSWSSPGLCYVISGHINRPYGPLAGVTISAGSMYSATSGADGAYTLIALPGSYTLTPTLSNYYFIPPSLNVTLPNANVTGQDFLALRPFSDCASEAEIPVAECNALVALYNSAGGAGWTKHTNWLVTDTPSDWFGVTVTSRHVTGIALGNNQLSGSIPAQMGDLAALENLWLLNNQLNGSIPTQLGKLVNLQTLDLSYNQLNGSIPTQLGNLVNLGELGLGNNQLSGSIPTQLGKLVNLADLGLENNQLSGGIPSQLGSLTNLHYLTMYSNQLSGSIPSQLGNLVHLQKLWLSNNQLSGSIPSQLGGLASLQSLDFSSNQLSGNIPPELGGLTNLIVLDLLSNQLSGSIPSQLGSLIKLDGLDLSSNQLSGSIPFQLESLTKLTNLNLSHNQLSGSIPTQLSSLADLMNLNISYNQLGGSIPSQLGNLPWLDSLNLSHNHLSGSVPSQLSGLTNLIILNLSSNPLSLRLPLSFTYLTHLVNFNAQDTWLCEPHDAAFQNWKAAVATWVSPGLCYSISGHVNRPGGALANVTISDGGVHSTTTDVDGAYTLLDLPPGSYILMASLAGHAFIPPSLGVTITNGDVLGQDFNATLRFYLPLVLQH